MAWVDQDRFSVGDAAWERVASLLPGKASDGGVTATDNRLFPEAVPWRVRTGLPRRGLPTALGRWNGVFRRSRRWARAGVSERLFGRLSDEPDFAYALIDGTIVAARQKAGGAKGGTRNRAIGRSRGGPTTKVVAPADALGDLARFVPPPGQRRDTIGVPPLIEGVAFGAPPGDRAFDVDRRRAELDARGAAAVVPPKAGRKRHLDSDRDAHRRRHLIEDTFAKPKDSRAVATRCDKTDTSFRASTSLAAAIIASR